MKILRGLGVVALLALAACGGKKTTGNQEINFSILATESSENL